MGREGAPAECLSTVHGRLQRYPHDQSSAACPSPPPPPHTHTCKEPEERRDGKALEVKDCEEVENGDDVVEDVGHILGSIREQVLSGVLHREQQRMCTIFARSRSGNNILNE